MKWWCIFPIVALIMAPLPAGAGMDLPQWHVGDWWEIDEVVDVEVTKVFPGSTIVIRDLTRYAITEVARRTQEKTGSDYEVYVMNYDGSMSMEGTMIILGISTNVRIRSGVLTGEQWNRVSDMHVVREYRYIYGEAEAESTFNPGEWKPMGTLEMNILQEYDPPIPYGYPLEVGKTFSYSLQSHLFGDFQLNTGFGHFGDDFYDVSAWHLDCQVKSLEDTECRLQEPAYYIDAAHLQGGEPARQQGWVEPGIKWYNKVELTRFAHPLGIVRQAMLCLTRADVYHSPSEQIQVNLDLNQAVYRAGDRFKLAARLVNPGEAITGDLYILLDISSLGAADPYYFFPSWINVGDGIDAYSMQIPPGETVQPVLDFTWPSGAGSASELAFYGTVTAPGTMNLISTIDHVIFDFE